MKDGEKSRPAKKANDPAATMLRMALPKIVLRGVSGTMFGRTLPLHRHMSIGRAPECDLVLDEPGVSRHHAEIERNFDEIWIRDLKSANGTFVNGTRIHETLVSVGDQVTFDQQRFLITVPGGIDQERAKKSPAAPSPVSVTRGMDKKRRLRRTLAWFLIAASLLLAWYLTR